MVLELMFVRNECSVGWSGEWESSTRVNERISPRKFCRKTHSHSTAEIYNNEEEEVVSAERGLVY